MIEAGTAHVATWLPIAPVVTGILVATIQVATAAVQVYWFFQGMFSSSMHKP
jgi:hypothetical protein